MRKYRFIIGFVVGVSLAVARGSVEAKDKSLHASFAGTCTNSSGDFSYTGTPGGENYCTAAGKSTLGQYTAQLVAELQPDGNTCTVAGGSGIELVVVGEDVVLSFTRRGEQLFLHLSPSSTSHSCLDLATGVGIGQVAFDVNGGTGRFAGASGSIVKTFQFIRLAPPADPPGKGFFGSFTGTFDGTIELAH
ncbi:MAG TPA: hypothetical protein VGX03_10260 [Candidatus Binatia bacterium]|nr:hypothetical protein [Candidatus Binatia bacterium]